MTEKRYTEEGISLPERGSAYPTSDGTPTPPEERVREPEKLVIPAQAVGFLLQAALQERVGNAWWQGFVTAHGLPSWVVSGEWALRTGDCEVVRRPPQGTNGSV